MGHGYSAAARLSIPGFLRLHRTGREGYGEGMTESSDSRDRIAALRREYCARGLREQDAALSPVAQFGAWFEEALAAEVDEPNAMVLATGGDGGAPAARVLLLKEFDEEGFVFFTNYRSRKGREMAANPRVCMLFFWGPLERQVRIEGTVERTSRAESEAYFQSRPRGSRVGAWASEQSAEIGSRAVLESAAAEVAARFGDGEIPTPPHWGGYRLRPERIEFWQGGADRLHDRLEYTRDETAESGWRLRRLAP